MITKELVKSDTENLPATASEDINEVVIAELEKAGLPAEIIGRVDIELKKNEDYTSNVSMNRTVEELPEIITALIDIIKEKQGELKTLTDKRGLWLDVLGTKGNIPSSDVRYHRRANISAIITGLVDDVYYTEYETDPETEQILIDEKTGNPKITKRYPVNIGIEKRNLDSLNNLAIDGNTRNTQARIFGAFGGGSGIGIDGRFEGLMGSMFESGRGNKR